MWIEGRVQGVFFRRYTREMARSLGLTGYVQNLTDGRVEAVFEGPDRSVRRMVSWCHTGPRTAAVERVRVSWEEPLDEFHSFSVRL